MKKLFYVLSVVLLFSSFLLAQTWTLNKDNIGRIYCGVTDPVDNSIMYVAGLDSGVYKTTDGGASWFAVNNGLTYRKIQAIAVAPSNHNIVYCGTDPAGAANGGVYKTTNGGTSWSLATTGITEPGIQTIVVHPTDPNTAWCGTFDAVNPSAVGLWKTINGGASWSASSTNIDPCKNILALAVNPLNPNVLYAGTSFISTAPTFCKIWKSLNGGTSWIDISTGLPPDPSTDPVRALAISPVDTAKVLAILFMNDTLGGAFITTNGGALWTRKFNGVPPTAGVLLRSCAFRPGSGQEMYVGIDNATQGGVWKTTDGGNNWAAINNGALQVNYAIRALFFKVEGLIHTLYAGSGTAGTGVYQYVFPPVPVELTSFTASVSGTTVKLNWGTATETNSSGFSVERKSNGPWETIGFVSSNGTTTSPHIYSFTDKVSIGNYTYRLKQIDLDGSFVYSKEIQVSIVKPDDFLLAQNYPNPFNPSTTISYVIPNDEFVTLKIFDVIGNEVAVLVSERQSAGGYTVNFKAADFNSGIYFYQIQAGNFVQTKKMTLIK